MQRRIGRRELHMVFPIGAGVERFHFATLDIDGVQLHRQMLGQPPRNAPFLGTPIFASLCVGTKPAFHDSFRRGSFAVRLGLLLRRRLSRRRSSRRPIAEFNRRQIDIASAQQRLVGVDRQTAAVASGGHRQLANFARGVRIQIRGVGLRHPLAVDQFGTGVVNRASFFAHDRAAGHAFGDFADLGRRLAQRRQIDRRQSHIRRGRSTGLPAARLLRFGGLPAGRLVRIAAWGPTGDRDEQFIAAIGIGILMKIQTRRAGVLRQPNDAVAGGRIDPIGRRLVGGKRQSPGRRR